MRIAYILPSLSRTGPNIVVHSIICSYVANKHDICVYYFDETENVLSFSCPTYRITMNDIIDFDSYDIIHSNMLRPDRYIYKNVNNIRKAKLVTTIHQDIFQNLKSSYNWVVASIITPIWLKYISSFTKSVPISGSIKELYSDRLDNLSNIIYNGVNVNYVPSSQDILYAECIKSLKKNNTIVLGTYAQITYRKGIDQIIELVNSRTDICAVIIGEGDAKSALEKKVYKLHLQDRIVFLPYLKDPYNYLENIDIYVMPSRSEGFGLAMIEAAFTHTPIVCSDLPVFRELFNDKQASFFQLDNVYSLSQAIDNVIRSKEQYSGNAYNNVLERFTKEIMADNYIQLYSSLLDGNK